MKSIALRKRGRIGSTTELDRFVINSSLDDHAEQNFVEAVKSRLPKDETVKKHKVTVQLSSSPRGDPKEDEKLQAKLRN
jgi:hypothetical protein